MQTTHGARGGWLEGIELVCYTLRRDELTRLAQATAAATGSVNAFRPAAGRQSLFPAVTAAGHCHSVAVTPEHISRRAAPTTGTCGRRGRGDRPHLASQVSCPAG